MAHATMTERAEQFKVAAYLRERPDKPLFTASLGGESPSARRRACNYRMGYQRGTPDLVIYERGVNGEPALFIELKVGNGRVSPAQADYIAALQARGFAAVVAWGSHQAIEAIKTYLPCPVTPPPTETPTTATSTTMWTTLHAASS